MGRAEDLFERLKQGGEAAVDELIDQRQSEELFLDFKRSADNGAGRRLHDRDRQNLARAISGFGNSEGGIVVWGVDCRERPGEGDLPGEKLRIADSKRFVSWIEGAVSGCTVPAHSGVQHHPIESGLAVTYVPKSPLAPHQCVFDLRYYIRAGSNFLPVPHAVLAGMFGRVPQPSLFHNWFTEQIKIMSRGNRGYVAHFKSVLAIHNRGPGVARDVYVNFRLWPTTGGSKFVSTIRRPDWTGESILGIVVSVVAPDGFKLAPGAQVLPIEFQFDLAPPFETPLTFKISFGCTNHPMLTHEKVVEPGELESLYGKCREEIAADREALQSIFADALLPGIVDSVPVQD